MPQSSPEGSLVPPQEGALHDFGVESVEGGPGRHCRHTLPTLAGCGGLQKGPPNVPREGQHSEQSCGSPRAQVHKRGMSGQEETTRKAGAGGGKGAEGSAVRGMPGAIDSDHSLVSTRAVLLSGCPCKISGEAQKIFTMSGPHPHPDP